MDVLHAVILSVPSEIAQAAPKVRGPQLSIWGRNAVERSAAEQGLRNLTLQQNPDGSPKPTTAGIFWSLSHKPDYVAGIAAKHGVGIDIEHIRPVREGMFERLATDNEWQQFRERNIESFFQVWTAKEAVLKAAGVGMNQLSACRIVSPQSPCRVTLNGNSWWVHHYSVDQHVIAVAACEQFNVVWHVVTKN